jgi:hypothetical protein
LSLPDFINVATIQQELETIGKVSCFLDQNSEDVCAFEVCFFDIFLALLNKIDDFAEVYLMPFPFSGPKMFRVGPTFLCQTKNLFTYCGSHKHFVPD